jgi:hypothetical protein
MPYVSDSQNILVGDAGVGAAGATARATVNDSSSSVSQTINFLQNPSLAGAAALNGKDIFPFRNELDQFASYAPIFTLGCLTNIELNFPLTYRTLGPAVKIIRSGGGGGPTVPSLYDLDGKREFFIEDVVINNTVAPNTNSRHMNLTQLNFKVIEPYSMGQFFHNLRTASLVTGHSNYIDAPFLLSVAFIGYDDEGNVKSPFFSQRHFPIQIVQVDMDVTASGAVYTIQAVPTTERAAIDRVAQIKTDVQLIGNTVAEILQTGAQSLAAEVNKLGDNQQSALQNLGSDKCVIMFPESSMLGALGGVIGALSSIGSAATSAFAGVSNKVTQLYESKFGKGADGNSTRGVDVLAQNKSIFTTGSIIGDKLKLEAGIEINEIGRSLIAKNGKYDGGRSPFQLPTNVQSLQNPGTVSRQFIKPTNTPTYTFKSGTSIPSIIEEVIITSEYGRAFAETNPDMAGRKAWFRIETHTYNTGSLFGSFGRGDTPKVYVYRVRTYKVDSANLSAPGSQALTGLARAAIKQLMTPKAYNYIYTGVNKDIIDFDLKFNMMYFTGVQAARSQTQMASILGGALGFGQGEREAIPTTGVGSGKDTGPAGTNRTGDVAKTETAGAHKAAAGGGPSDDPQTGTARSLNDMVINGSNDMIGVELKIHGDPYFLCDVGIGNYLGLPSSPLLPVTLDGSMNPLDGEVYVILNFRTPIDYNQDDGYVEYPLGGFLPIASFSGVYQVITVESNFQNGKFVQTLTLVRKRNSDLSLEAGASALLGWMTGGGAAIQIGRIFNKLNSSQPPVDAI